MSGGLLIGPSYCEDLLYSAKEDRFLLEGLTRAGVSEREGYLVGPGAGTQVNVGAGIAFIPYDAAQAQLYGAYNDETQSPYNTAIVSGENPQIAQIILRVYDVNELKISGNSFARIEWLNGVPNAGATEAHVKEGLASSYGAAELPISSLRIYYVVVPKNATSSSEFHILDAREFGTPLILGNVYSNFPVISKSELETGVEPSYARLTFVSFRNESADSVNVLVGSSIIGTVAHDATLTFLVPPGLKWKLEGPEIIASHASTLVL